MSATAVYVKNGNGPMSINSNNVMTTASSTMVTVRPTTPNNNKVKRGTSKSPVNLRRTPLEPPATPTSEIGQSSMVSDGSGNTGGPFQQQQNWRSNCRHTVVNVSDNGILNLSILGGSDNGEFAYLGQLQQERINYVSGLLENGDILLDIQGQKVVGYTRRDVVAWLNHCCRSGHAVNLRVTSAGSLTKDLRLYLNTRFVKGSPDHDLQNTIRDNLYLRTVPCTTRPKRDGEVDGVDYTFLTLEQFLALESSGNLLESGIYEGNHYGTPKPPKETPMHGPPVRSGLANGTPPQAQAHPLLPGAHPSSEGKRRRNRSNVEAMSSKTMDPDGSGGGGGNYSHLNNSVPRPPSTASNNAGPLVGNGGMHFGHANDDGGFMMNGLDETSVAQLGPLGSNWEKAYTENGEPYYIDHSTGTSQWLDPRLARVQKKSIEDCADDELPYGWEKIDDPQFGTYYIDHINRQTQYENPVIQAKRAKNPHSYESNSNYSDQSNQQQQFLHDQGPPPVYLTNGHGAPTIDNSFDDSVPLRRDNGPPVPAGPAPPPVAEKPHHPDAVHPPTSASHPLCKPQSQGLNAYFPCIPCLTDTYAEQDGVSPLPPPTRPTEPPPTVQFTRNPSELWGEFLQTKLRKSQRGFGFTIVGGDDKVEEFLQIKSVVPDGPAWRDGKLLQGDILVHVGDTCVLGFTHHDMVTMFQSFPVGSEVTLEVCRGYPLPFDPDDPNTEIVSTLAVNATDGPPTSNHHGGRGDDHHHQHPHRAPPPPPLPVGGFHHQQQQQQQRHDPASERNPRWGGPEQDPNWEGQESGWAEPERDSRRGEAADEEEEEEEVSMALRRAANMSLDGSSTPDILEFYGNRSHDGGMPLPTEILTVAIVKGLMGFGFTIADSSNGQKVKKILDRPRCKNLMEGDVLLEINGRDVRGLEHSLVVQFLKDCPQGLEATVVVQRGGSRDKLKYKLLKSQSKSMDDGQVLKNDLGRPHDVNYFNNNSVKSFEGGLAPHGQYRSKTPTADLYGSHREVIPNRPKTPLVDTRNRPKTPTTNNNNNINASNNNNNMRPKTPSTGYQGEPLDTRPHVGPGDDGRGGGSSGVLGPSSLYGVGGSDVADQPRDSWNQSSARFDNQNRVPPLHQHHGYANPPANLDESRRSAGSSINGSQSRGGVSAEWPPDVRPPLEDAYYGYDPATTKARADDFSAQQHHQQQQQQQGRKTPSNEHHYQYTTSPPNQLQDEPTYGSYGRSQQGSGGSSYPSRNPTYNGSNGNFQPQYNNNVGQNGGGNAGLNNSYYGGGGGSSFEGDPSSLYLPVQMRRQGTSFEREQPSPVTQVGGRPNVAPANSWYGGGGGGPQQQQQQPPPPLPHLVHHHQQPQQRAVSSSSSHSPMGTMISDNAEMVITLYKQENGFGFRIVGGTEEGSQVSIGHIVPGGAADVDGRLHTGDEITAVDGQSVLHTSHHHVVQLMGQAAHNGRVSLGIRRRTQPRDVQRVKSWDGGYPYDVTVVRRENEGFGFVIISSVTRAGSTIGRIIDSSPAERCGKLHVGDRILAVNGKDIMNLHHGEIVNFIKDSGFTVTLTIGPPQDDASSTTSASQRNANLSVVSAMALPAVGDPSEVLHRRSLYSSTPCLPMGLSESAPRRTPAYTGMNVGDRSSDYSGGGGGNRGFGGGGGGGGYRGGRVTAGGGYSSRPSPHRYSYYSAHDALGNSFDAWRQEEGFVEDEQYYAVELFRGTRGFGFSIRGGREFQNMPLFVLRIAEDGPAARDGRLRMGDQIVEINGINTKDMTHGDAIELIKQGGSSVRLLIKRGGSKLLSATHPLDHRGLAVGNGTQQQHPVTSPVLAGSLPMNGPSGYLLSGTTVASPHLTNGPLGQSSPRVTAMGDKDQYCYEYERGPV